MGRGKGEEFAKTELTNFLTTSDKRIFASLQEKRCERIEIADIRTTKSTSTEIGECSLECN